MAYTWVRLSPEHQHSIADRGHSEQVARRGGRARDLLEVCPAEQGRIKHVEVVESLCTCSIGSHIESKFVYFV